MHLIDPKRPSSNFIRAEVQDPNKEFIEYLTHFDTPIFQNAIISRICQLGEPKIILNHCMGVSIGRGFVEALKEYDLKVEIDYKILGRFKDKFSDYVARDQVQNFDKEVFEDSTLFHDYLELFSDLLAKTGFTVSQRLRIKKYIAGISKIRFLELIDKSPEIYRQLETSLFAEDYDFLKRNLNKELYFFRLRVLFTQVTLYDPKGLTLDHIYQDPHFSIFDRCTRLYDPGNDENSSVFISVNTLGLGKSLVTFTKDWLSGNVDWNAFQGNTYNTLIVFGYPGQGKTSFCKRLLADPGLYTPALSNVYFLRFRDIRKPLNLSISFFSTVLQTLNKDHKLDLVESDLENALLILDGFDELRMANDMSSANVQEIVKNFQLELRHYDGLRIIMTARFGFLDLERLMTNRTLLIQLKQFDLDQQVKWVEAYHEFYPDCWLNRTELKRINSKKAGLSSLVSQPVLLHMLAKWGEPFGPNLDNRSEVLDSILELIISPSWKDSQIEYLSAIKKNELRWALQEIAFAIFCSPLPYLHKKKLENLTHVQRLREKLVGKSNYDFKDLLKMMMVTFYFRERPRTYNDNYEDRDNDYGIEFLDETIQQYLCARYIWETICGELLLKDSYGGYRVKSNEDVLEFLQELFGAQSLGPPIAKFLKEVIDNDTQSSKKVELATRLKEGFQYLLERQFLRIFDAEIHHHPITISLRIFLGFWSVYGNITKHRLIPAGEDAGPEQQNFIKYLKIVLTQEQEFRGITLDLSGLNLSRGQFYGVRFPPSTNLTETDLTGALMHNIHLVRGNLTNAKLNNADLSNADLRGTDFKGVEMDATNLEGTRLTRARNLEPQNLIYTKKIEKAVGVSRGLLEQVHSMRVARLIELVLIFRMNGGHSNFDNLFDFLKDYFDSDFADHPLELDGLIMTNFELFYIRFAEGTSLVKADFCGSTLRNVTLRKANLGEAVLRLAKIQGVDFSGADMTGVDLSDASLENCIFSDVIGLTIEQLLSTESITELIGIPENLMKEYNLQVGEG